LFLGRFVADFVAALSTLSRSPPARRLSQLPARIRGQASALGSERPDREITRTKENRGIEAFSISAFSRCAGAICTLEHAISVELRIVLRATRSPGCRRCAPAES